MSFRRLVGSISREADEKSGLEPMESTVGLLPTKRVYPIDEPASGTSPERHEAR
jgi:hypothetical protein